MAADVAGYSRRTGIDETGTLLRFQAIMDDIVKPIVAKGRGRIFKSMGDGILAEFHSATDALFYASEIQAAMAARNSPLAGHERIEFRIGVHQGDVVAQDDGDLLGDNVNIVARLQTQAQPGGICVSDRIQQDAKNRLDVSFEYMGQPELKNIEWPVPTYRVFPGRTPQPKPSQASGLIALGPDTVCEAELTGFGPHAWEFRLHEFVIGDINRLISFGENFGATRQDRYVLVNAIGDGRRLAAAPSFARSGGGFTANCPILPKFPPISAHDLGTDLALSTDGDLFIKDGSIATVSGLEALSQKIRTSLSLVRGESPLHPTFGSRLAEYYNTYRNSPWLTALMRLEVIRQAVIPYEDDLQHREYTPLQCIDRVWGIGLLADQPENRWLPVRFDLEVAGVGRRELDVEVLIPDEATLMKIAGRAESTRRFLFPGRHDGATPTA